ncbi:MAG: hypothetical protein IT370_22360 [Deltaproteobacteria bacterium]|nr:hypothetical protein [Deltaproteobacteria bacterium]
MGVRGNATPESAHASARPGRTGAPGSTEDERRSRGAVGGAGYAGPAPGTLGPGAASTPGSAASGGGVSGGEPLLSDKELKQIEADNPDGLTSVRLLEVFQNRGIRLSEATFRKYVQLGLLPRCVRVGKKGLHQGSQGIYPAATIRRINTIKRMMVDGATIEEIQRSFIRWKDEIEGVEGGLRDLFAGFDRAMRGPEYEREARRALAQELADAKQTAAELLRRIHRIERQLAAPLDDLERTPGGGGAAGGAEELL